MMLAANIGLALLALAAPLQQGPGGVRGVVRSEASGAALSGAVVEVVGGGPGPATTTDQAGAYQLRDVPPGRRTIRARHLGFAPMEVEVVIPAGREVQLDLSLPARPVPVEPVTVKAGGPRSATDTVAAPTPELGLAGTRALDATPGLAELGLAEAAQGVPGQEPADPSGVLYVRGAAADLKTVFLDGAPVYAPFPLGGLLDAFTPELLRSADVYLGGAPARYDGGLSYVLDLRTRGVRRDAVHSSGALDLLSTRAMLETPLPGRASVLAAGRAVHGLGTRELLGETLPYGYREGLLRADLEVGETGMVSLTGFHNEEEVWLDPAMLADSSIAWGNSALSLRYRGTLAHAPLELTAALSDYQARLPLEGTQPIVADGSVRRLRLSADLARDLGPVHLRYGTSFDRQEQSYRAETGTVAPAGYRYPAHSEALGDVLGVYADAAWSATPRVRLRGGLRADHFSLGSGIVLAPRLSATWLVSERAALTVAAGRYHQYLRAPEEALLAQVATPRVMGEDERFAPGPPAMAVGEATHMAVSLDQELAQGVRLGLEGFFKSFRGVPGTPSTPGNASGVDVWVRRSAGQVTGWLGYSLAWVWSVSEGAQAESFAGRHLLSTGLGVPLGSRGRVDLRVVYGSGLPYSAIPVGVQENWADVPAMTANTGNVRAAQDTPPLLQSPDRPYLRLDLTAAHSWTPRWSGGRMTLAPYVRVLNTLGRRDALFYYFERERDNGPRPVASLPLVPVLGVEWKF